MGLATSEDRHRHEYKEMAVLDMSIDGNVTVLNDAVRVDTAPRRMSFRLPFSRRHVRLLLGVFWLIAAGLQAQPVAFRSVWWRTSLAQSAMGEPTVIRHSILGAVSIIAAHPVPWNALFVVIQGCLGLALLLGRCERGAVVASIPWALGIWWVGEGLGALPTGFGVFAAGAPGAVLLYPLIGLLAWPGPRGASETDRPIAAKGAVGLWLALWSGQALLYVPWKFPSGQLFEANIEESSGGPNWMLDLSSHAERIAVALGPELAVGIAVTSLLIGLSVLSTRWRRFGLALGIAILLIFWVLFQGAGGLVSGDATDVGMAPLVVVLALGMWIPHRRWERTRAPESLGPLSPVMG